LRVIILEFLIKRVSILFAGAQMGTVISLPLSGLLSISDWRWPGIFYIFGALGTVWCLAFLIWVKEDPQSNRKMDPVEREYIQTSLGTIVGNTVSKSGPIWIHPSS